LVSSLAGGGADLPVAPVVASAAGSGLTVAAPDAVAAANVVSDLVAAGEVASGGAAGGVVAVLVL
jgi:hypothetical protein